MNYIELTGFVAATCTTVSFVPQAVKTIRTKSTKDISLNMYVLLCVGTLLWFTYGILISSMPVIAANSVTLVLGLMILGMKIKHG